MSSIFDPIRVANYAARARENPIETRAPYIKKRHGGPNRGSPALDEMVAHIRAALEQTGYVPTIEDLRQRMGWKQVHSVKDCLQRCYVQKLIDAATHNAILATHQWGRK
jgi:hypothetical protein